MDVVTEIFQKYRISARMIWNVCFWPDADLDNWDGRDQFEKIKELLFESMVVRKLSLQARHSQFLVIPRIEGGVPVKIERPRKGDRNRYWDHPISTLESSDAILQFLDYFDWDPITCVDFRYVRVRICKFPMHANLVGREALLEADHVEICLMPDAVD